MAKNKMSFWAVFILVMTIIMTALFVVSVVGFATSIGPVQDAARTEAAKTLSEPELSVAVGLVVGGVIAAFAVSSILEVLQIIGGFLFSLKGRWGIFCIVMAILSGVSNVWELISAISSKAAVLSIVTASIGLVLSVLMIIACFKHRAENRA